MLKRLRARQPLRLVYSEQSLDQILCGWVNGIKLRVIEVEGSLTHGPIDLSLVRAMEGKEAAEDDVHHNPQAPTVALLAVVALEHLGCQIVRRTHDCLKSCILAIKMRGELAQAEVDYLDALVGAIHHVFRLDVPVGDPHVVQVVDC